MYHRNAKVKTLKHYKKFEQTEFELKTTTQIKMFDKVTSGQVKGITFGSAGETTITMRWNKEGPPTMNDIHIEVHQQSNINSRKFTVS